MHYAVLGCFSSFWSKWISKNSETIPQLNLHTMLFLRKQYIASLFLFFPLVLCNRKAHIEINLVLWQTSEHWLHKTQIKSYSIKWQYFWTVNVRVSSICNNSNIFPSVQHQFKLTLDYSSVKTSIRSQESFPVTSSQFVQLQVIWHSLWKLLQALAYKRLNAKKQHGELSSVVSPHFCPSNYFKGSFLKPVLKSSLFRNRAETVPCNACDREPNKKRYTRCHDLSVNLAGGY